MIETTDGDIIIADFIKTSQVHAEHWSSNIIITRNNT